MFRYLYERKKLTLFLVCTLYCILYHLSYNRLWKGVTGIQARAPRSPDGWLSFWNSSWLVINSLLVEESVKSEPSIAIGSGITSRKLRDVSDDNIGAKFQFFNTFLPTFCRTASSKFLYKFYLAYDRSDQVFSSPQLRDAFRRYFHTSTASRSCRDRDITANLSLVACTHTGKPTWAQNDAMLEAYLDHVDYFYRVNDDTRMLTGGWTEKFISKLKSYDPPLVGVVGPNHSGGNTAILTYDFVHRTHIDIFGFYYPRLFTDWWGDDWMTRVYKPNRSTKIGDVRLAHMLGLGQRYAVHWQVRSHLHEQLAQDMDIVARSASRV